MQFLHAGLHADRLRQIRDTRPVVVTCPGCGGQWFADWPDAPLPLDGQDAIIPAIAALARACPDHAHRFTV